MRMHGPRTVSHRLPDVGEPVPDSEDVLFVRLGEGQTRELHEFGTRCCRRGGRGGGGTIMS